MKVRNIICGVIAVLSFAVPAIAQNKVIFTDNQLHPGAPVPEMCLQEGQKFISIVSVYPAVHNWTFYIVCNEKSWRQFVRRSGQLNHGVLVTGVAYHNEPDVQVYGTTYLAKHVTYLRGYKLIHPDPGVSAERIIVHELAHIVYDSSDEVRDEHQAQEWIAEHHRTGLPVTAGSTELAANGSGEVQ